MTYEEFEAKYINGDFDDCKSFGELAAAINEPLWRVSAWADRAVKEMFKEKGVDDRGI